jgi:predicted alpha/beta-fold hydrolase
VPIINSTYQAKGLFKSGHFSTIYSAKLRPTLRLKQTRKRLELTDSDFIDVDWSYHISEVKASHKVVILLHGLEGNAQRGYIKGQGQHLNKNGWDVAAINHRGCSGEDNRLYLSYNSGRTEDLAEFIEHIIARYSYDEISIVGYSLGGNVLLKYLGECTALPHQVKSGVAISTPLHLRGALEQLIKWENFVYSKTFINDLRKKYKRKMSNFPEAMNTEELKKIGSLLDFDNLYTAKAHGFKDAFDYYEKSSSIYVLENIKVPVLILNAENDSFLCPESYPFGLIKNLENVYLEVPRHGGHVGFHESNNVYYSERRVIEFLTDAVE